MVLPRSSSRRRLLISLVQPADNLSRTLPTLTESCDGTAQGGSESTPEQRFFFSVVGRSDPRTDRRTFGCPPWDRKGRWRGSFVNELGRSPDAQRVGQYGIQQLVESEEGAGATRSDRLFYVPTVTDNFPLQKPGPHTVTGQGLLRPSPSRRERPSRPPPVPTSLST